MRPITLHEGKLVWSGEHWLAALRPEGAERPSAWVSLQHTRHSPAGEGNVAQVMMAGAAPYRALCTDNPELAEFARARLLSSSSVPLDPDTPTVTSRFHREGDIRRQPAWVIEAPGHRIVARWRAPDAPVIVDGSFAEGTEHFSVLFFVEEAVVEFDGVAVADRPSPRDIWRGSIGGDRSSCFFALAESFIELPA